MSAAEICKTDEALAAAAQNGDRQALDFIINKYKPVVKAKSARYFLMGADRADIIQEGMIGLFNAVMGFDQKKHSSFYFFAEMCIVRQVLTAVKIASRKKHGPLNSYVSLSVRNDESRCPDRLRGIDPEDIVIGREEKDGLLGKLGDVLSGLEARVLLLSMQGLSYAEIADKLCLNRKAIDNALQRVRKKLSGIRRGNI